MREGTPVPFVSVIVPVFGAARTLEASLRSIAESAYPSFEIVAADDGSTDASRGLLESFGVRIVRLDHSGPAAARNRAVAIARGDVLFFTDADVVIRPDTIARGVAALTADPEIAAVFGSYTAESGPGGFFTHYRTTSTTSRTSTPSPMRSPSGRGAASSGGASSRRTAASTSHSGFSPTSSSATGCTARASAFESRKTSRSRTSSSTRSWGSCDPTSSAEPFPGAV